MVLSNKAPPPLCTTCENIFAPSSFEWWQHQSNDTEFSREHHASEQSFRDAVNEGCWICYRLAHDRKLNRVYGLGYRYNLAWSDRHKSFELKFDTRKGVFPIFIRKVEDWLPCLELASRSRSQVWTGCEDVANLAADWLRVCKIEHKCLSAPERQWYPTRLLEIANESVRLVASSSEPQLHGPYATLSHCWGTRQFTVLTSKNMSQFLEGFPTHCLPQAFREAIETVRRLQIRYLWIDCYCIIQGSDNTARADWDHEASQMGQVYSNSFLNIGSAHSSSPHDGLYCTRGCKDLQTLLIEWQPTRGDTSSRFMLSMALMSDLLSEAFRDLEKCIISTRAWVVQEVALSPRMLSFGSKQVFWQCVEAAACEDFPRQHLRSVDWAFQVNPFWTLADSTRILQSNRNLPAKGHFACHPSGGGPRVSLEERWFGALGKYSQAKLTYHEHDVFRAIDGLGERIGLMTGQGYRHGILGGTLPVALLWQTSFVQRGKVSSELAPSWHWASHQTHDSLSFLTITSLYSQVRHGALRMLPLAYVSLSDDCQQFTSQDGATDLWPYLICIGRPVKLVAPDRSQHSVLDHLITDGTLEEVYPIMDGEKELGWSSKYVYLPLLVWYNPTDLDETKSGLPGPVSSQGLLLQEVSRGRFRRVGICHDLIEGNSCRRLSERAPELIILE